MRLNQKALRLFGAASIFLAHHPLSALIDPENASFTDTRVDLIVYGTGYNLRVQPTYSSRSLHPGIFGFGQCSDFETKLTPTNEGTLTVTHCGAGQITEFYRSSQKPQDAQVVEAILEKMKASIPNSSEKYWEKVKNDLLFDAGNRRREAKKYGIAMNQKPDSGEYRAGGTGADRIVFNNDSYTRYLIDGTVQIFSKTGELNKVSDRNGNSIQLVRKSGKLVQVLDSDGRSLNFTYYPNSRLVKEVKGPNGVMSKYFYEDASKENLTRVINAWGNEYKFEYDNLHNQTKKIYPDKTFQQLTYNTQRDWVTSFQNRSGCLEKYNYEFDKKNPELHYWATVKKTCKGKVVADNKYEFWFEKDDRGRASLKKTKSVENGKVTEVELDNRTGRPALISKDGVKTQFRFNSEGLIEAKMSNTENITYNYYPHKKVKQMIVEYLNDKGKVTKKIVTDFEYDKKLNLRVAKNSEGQRVVMTPDGKGRVKRLEDQARRVLFIEYDERFANKPKKIKRQGMGWIDIVYKPNGEMEKVDSKQSPEVAQQIASSFNNLLDIIGPASQDVSL